MKVKYEVDDKVKESLRGTSDTMTLEMSPRAKESGWSFEGTTFRLRKQSAYKRSKVTEGDKRCRTKNATMWAVFYQVVSQCSGIRKARRMT